MKTFKQYIKEQFMECPHGIYIKVTPTTDSVIAIKRAFAKLENNGQTLLDDLHCTVMTARPSQPDVSVFVPSIDKDRRFYARVSHLEYWPGNSENGYIVCVLDSPDLDYLQQQFREGGLVPTFEDYKPHVSLMHPVNNPDDMYPIIQEINDSLDNDNYLEFYYGGYVLLDV